MSTSHSNSRPRWLGLGVSVLALALSGPACGDDELPATAQRGAPGGGKKKGKKKAGSRRTGKGAAAGDGLLDEEVEDPGVKRPPPLLDATSFAKFRDPFQGFVAAEPVEPEPDPIRAEREVEMRQYSFEDLKLIGITSTRRSGASPRALFVANDGISGSIRQGQFFSSAEVLLVAVNRDYVEIEVVDEELSASLGMERGERRALYLRND
ncbi:MAG: hypothetical protein AAF799_33080 [Myxococcota bacterium]